MESAKYNCYIFQLVMRSNEILFTALPSAADVVDPSHGKNDSNPDDFSYLSSSILFSERNSFILIRYR